MFDVFYIGKKPGLFPHEQSAESIEQACKMSRTRFCWIVNYLSDYTGWDWLWEPVPWQAHQRHAWASQWQKDSGTYLVPQAGYTDTHYHSDQIITRLPSVENWTCLTGIEEFDLSWHPDPTEPIMVYQFGTQHQPTGGPCYSVPGASTIKYVQQPRAVKTSVDACWIKPDNIDSDSFDWTWHPDARDPAYIYQFGTQHQRTGGPQYAMPGATETKFVDQIRVRTQRTATKVYVIDHMDNNLSAVHAQIDNPNCTAVRYFDNYLDTLKRIAKNADSDHHEFVWITSSICDYTDFDWTWHPEQWQATLLHVFASDNEKFGDTFFMHVPTFLLRADKCQLLEWYDLNFVQDKSVPRRPIPVIQHNYDSQVEAVKTQQWSGPLALFTRTDYVDRALATVPLWRESTKTIVPLDPGASSVIVPRAAVPYIKTQLYDYPYIDRDHVMLKGEPLDIVFMSNGEKYAEHNYEHLKWSVEMQCRDTNKIHRVKNVKGRVASQHAAANASTTDWYFVVPGKLEVDYIFDWTWQPDRMQQAKHYIFHAGNPVNGLVYGHMAMVAYNKKLVLETQGTGLDFTMEKAHEVVPIISGTANYAETPMMAWRTAFREALKLRHSLPDVENEYRLNAWLREDSGTIANGHWSHKGAQDAMEFYNEVKGNPTELHKSYEWDWLASYAFVKRGLSE